MYRQFIFTIILIAGLVIASISVNKWEKANNYPFGKLCDVFNSCSNN